MTVITATARPARGRPIAGSRNAIWWTMNPICAISATANGPATLQNAGLRNAVARVQAPADSCGDETRRRRGAGGRSIQRAAAGTTVIAMIAAAPTMAVWKPTVSIASTSAGVIRMPPKLAPLRARLIASPRCRSNHRPTMVVIAPVCIAAAPAASRR